AALADLPTERLGPDRRRSELPLDGGDLVVARLGRRGARERSRRRDRRDRRRRDGDGIGATSCGEDRRRGDEERRRRDDSSESPEERATPPGPRLWRAGEPGLELRGEDVRIRLTPRRIEGAR